MTGTVLHFLSMQAQGQRLDAYSSCCSGCWGRNTQEHLAYFHRIGQQHVTSDVPDRQHPHQRVPRLPSRHFQLEHPSSQLLNWADRDCFDVFRQVRDTYSLDTVCKNSYLLEIPSFRDTECARVNLVPSAETVRSNIDFDC